MQIRNSLSKLKSTGEITVKPTNEYSIITIKNYKSYQDCNRRNNAQGTQEQQADNRRATTNNNDINSTINAKECINISLSAKNEKPKITKDEREILKTFSKKEGAKNINAYVRKLIDNGDYLTILEEEKKKAAKRKAQQALLEEQKEEEQQTQEAEMSAEEKEAFMKKIREKAGITGNKRRSKK